MNVVEENRTPLLIGFEATEPSVKLQQHLTKINPAGVILFKRNIVSLKQCRELVRQIRGILGDILVAIDHEGGLVSRFPSEVPVPPSPRALAKSGDNPLIRAACRMQAELLRSVDINLNFAPVLDLALSIDNQVIGTRAFGPDPIKAANYGQICIEMHQSCRVGTAAKHFPGYGRSSVDTHFATGRVTANEAQLFGADLLPFQTAVDAGVDAIMTAHLIYTAFDPVFPAGLSQTVVDKILRRRIGFKGLVISDCVEMGAIDGGFTPDRIIDNGLKAGTDLIVSSFSLKKCPEFQYALKSAWDSFRRDDGNQALISASTDRRRRFSRAYPVGNKGGWSIPTTAEAVAIHRKTIGRIRETSLPEAYTGFYLIELSNREDIGINPDEGGNPVVTELSSKLHQVRKHTVIRRCHHQQFSSCIDEIRAADLVLLLFTANGFRLPGYDTWIQLLQRVPFTIHVALLEDADLSGLAAIEWVTWGFNSMTTLAVKAVLDELIETGPKGRYI
jgi:beta-glucosidase-like glycosyl hydrolase